MSSDAKPSPPEPAAEAATSSDEAVDQSTPAPSNGGDNPAAEAAPPTANTPVAPASEKTEPETSAPTPRPKPRLIGSQRQQEDPPAPPEATPSPTAADASQDPPAEPPAAPPSAEATPSAEAVPETESTPETDPVAKVKPREKVPIPNLRDDLPDDLQQQLDAALDQSSDEASVDALLAGAAAAVPPPDEPEIGGRRRTRVIKVDGDHTFVEMGARHQGVVPTKQFQSPLEPGAQIEVIVTAFQQEEGLYHCSRPGAALGSADWDSLDEGAVVKAVVTGHNKGGLECKVKSLRGFIPASQIALHRVEKLEEFTGQSFETVVLEVKPEKRRLVVSRKAILLREAETKRAQLWEDLEVGQIRDGVVRSIQDFGAFIDLGGLDGLLHVSQLSWSRVRHPSDLLQAGQTVKVKVTKIQPEGRKVSLSLRDLVPNPWQDIESRYAQGTQLTGKVTKTTEFGAFVELDDGIEGLVHISQLAHHRVASVTDVVQQGQELEVQVLSVDQQKKRIALSYKATLDKPVTKRPPKETPEEAAAAAARRAEQEKRRQALKGGVDRPSGGDQFGLKW